MAACSFVAGLAEAALLVLLANLALSIGSASGENSALAAGLGPFGELGLSIPSSFLAALVLTAARLALALTSAAIASRLTAELTASIRAGTFGDFATASWAEQSRRDEAEIQDLLQRHVNKATSSVGMISQGIGTTCTVVALLISAVLVDPASASLLVISGAGLFVAIRPLSGWAKSLSKAQIIAGRNYAHQSLEAIGASLEIRSFGVGKQISDRLDETTQSEVVPIQKSLILKQIVSSTYQTATVLLLLGGLFAVYSVFTKPLASLGAIVVILIRSLNQAAGLQGCYHALSENTPFIHRLAEQRAILRQSTPRSGNVPLDHMSGLSFNSVDYSYDGVHVALSSVSFEIPNGEAVGIIGPSGSGKSTLIQILLRLREPDSGEYLVGGIDASKIDDESWFSQIAFVPQDSRVINDTVAANISFFRPEVTRDDVVAAAKRAHIHGEIVAMPNGYDTELGSRGGALSGGQRQRISIARALVRRPSILVLDEPTSALDLRSEALIHETFTELKSSVTIFVIAHRLSTLNSCDRIMVMVDGRLEAFGARSELEASNEFYRDSVALSQIRTDRQNTNGGDAEL